MKHKPDKKATLPKDFNAHEYARAFRLLDPPTISNITPVTPTKDVIYWTNDAFWKYIDKLKAVDMARQIGQNKNNLLISYYAENILIHMNILPIVISSGVRITFSNYEVKN